MATSVGEAIRESSGAGLELSLVGGTTALPPSRFASDLHSPRARCQRHCKRYARFRRGLHPFDLQRRYRFTQSRPLPTQQGPSPGSSPICGASLADELAGHTYVRSVERGATPAPAWRAGWTPWCSGKRRSSDRSATRSTPPTGRARLAPFCDACCRSLETGKRARTATRNRLGRCLSQLRCRRGVCQACAGTAPESLGARPRCW